MRPVRKDVLFDERHRLHHRRTTLDTVVALSVEGVSISAVSRVEDISWSAVARCLERAAQVCRRFNRETIAGFAVTELQADEIRTFTGGKTRPTWTFGAIEVWSRLWPSTVTGRRSYWNTLAFIRDVSRRCCMTPDKPKGISKSTTTRKAGGLMKAPRRGLHRAEGG